MPLRVTVLCWTGLWPRNWTPCSASKPPPALPAPLPPLEQTQRFPPEMCLQREPGPLAIHLFHPVLNYSVNKPLLKVLPCVYLGNKEEQNPCPLRVAFCTEGAEREENIPYAYKAVNNVYSIP